MDPALTRGRVCGQGETFVMMMMMMMMMMAHILCCQEEILPAVLEFSDDTEEEFLSAVITHLEPTMTAFKLSPAYILYMATR